MKTKNVIAICALALLNIIGFYTVVSAQENSISSELYQHPDPKTTEYLNFASGKERISIELKSEIQVKMLFSMIFSQREFYSEWDNERKDQYLPYFSLLDQRMMKRMNSIHSDADYVTYRNSDDYVSDAIDVYYEFRCRIIDTLRANDKVTPILKFLVETHRISADTLIGMDYQSKRRLVADKFNNLDETSEQALRQYTDARYKALWTVHKQHGSPKIRIGGLYTPCNGEGMRASYLYASNTIILTAWQYYFDNWFIDDLFAELSHSEQWRRYPKHIMDERLASEKHMLDSLVALDGINTGDETFNRCKARDKYAYDMSSTVNGYPTIENEAHSMFQPELIEEFNSYISAQK